MSLIRHTLALTLALGSLPAAAHADEPLTVALDADVPVDADAFRDGLAADLDEVVRLGDPSAARLRIAMREDEVELSYRDGAASRTRRVALPADRGEATASLVLIASNLVRDPTDAMIAAPAPAPPPGEVSAPAVPLAEPLDLASRRPFRLGLGLLGGAASTATGVEGYGYFGVDLMGTVHPHLAVGVTRLSLGPGFSNIESFIFSLQGTPTLEAFVFVDPRVQLYAQVGVALQGRAQTNAREGHFQAAAFVGAGARFWLTDWLTIGVEIGLHVVATDAFVMGNVALPQGSIAGSGGVSLGFSF